MEKVIFHRLYATINKKHLLVYGVCGFIVLGLFVGSRIVLAGSNNPFGGRITIAPTDYCSASCGTVGHVITVGPPRGGRFHYKPGFTKLYQFYQIARNGVWVLGTYRPGQSPCERRVAHHCVTIPNQGAIEIVGTSN